MAHFGDGGGVVADSRILLLLLLFFKEDFFSIFIVLVYDFVSCYLVINDENNRSLLNLSML